MKNIKTPAYQKCASVPGADRTRATTLASILCAPAALLFVAVSSVGMLATAQASQFGVRVVNDAGEPVAGASVCIGLPGNYTQFGALFTDGDGTVVVDVPNVPLVVTVSKTRFSGKRLSEPARGFNLIKEIRLSEGVPGPRCKAGSTMAANPPSITIAEVDISKGGNATTLRPTVSGEPSHYRVSTSEDFEGSNWQRFSDSIALPSALSRSAEVFLQMRRFEGTSRGWVEARSEVVTVQLPTIR